MLAENGAWWAPDIITRMDSKWEGDHATRKFGPAAFRSGLTLKPSEYVNRNCWYAASVMFTTEVDRRHAIGVDNLMWGSDYPHPEGSWPNTRSWLANRFGHVPEDKVRRILGLTAVQVYGIDLNGLAAPETFRGSGGITTLSPGQCRRFPPTGPGEPLQSPIPSPPLSAATCSPVRKPSAEGWHGGAFRQTSLTGPR